MSSARQGSPGSVGAVAQTDGYALVFRVGAALLAVAAVGVLVLLEHVTAKPRTALAEAQADDGPRADGFRVTAAARELSVEETGKARPTTRDVWTVTGS